MATHLRLGGVRRLGFMPGGSTARATTSHEGEAILHHLVDFLDAFMWQADPRTLEITFVTDGVREILGHPIEAWLGDPEHWSRSIHLEDRQRVIDTLRATGLDGVDRDVEFHARAADGEMHTLRHAVRLIAPPSGENELWIITTDVTEHVRTEEELRKTRDRYRALSVEAAEFKRRSLEDPLTHLPNRVLLQERLGSTLRSSRRTGSPFAVLLIDLDRFKELNDTFGHQAGDRALKEVALRLRICLREGDTPARIGGDEFAALLPDTNESGALHVAERAAKAISETISTGYASPMLGASIGVAVYPRHGREPDELLAAADMAMYRAKSNGGGYELAAVSEDTPVPAERRRTRHRVVRRIAIAAAATLAILAGAMIPVPAGQRSEQSFDAAGRLHAAAVVLESSSNVDIGGVVAGVEDTLAQIAWGDVAKRDVSSALERLERSLHELRSGVVGALGERVESLIASINQAEAVADAIDELKKSPPNAHAPDRPAPPKSLKGPRPTPGPAVSLTPEPSLP